MLPQNGSNRGDLIAEATHLRAYLRKFSVMAEQAAVYAAERADRQARHTLDSYATKAAAREAKAKAKAKELAPQAARYAQSRFLAGARSSLRVPCPASRS